MRRYLYAGVVAGGLLLFGTVPAHADVQPAPINDHPGADGGVGLLGVPISGLPIGDLLGGGLLGGGGLGGGSPLGGGLSPKQRYAQESGLLGDNMSLLGGLGGINGLLPISSARTFPAVSGMPAGGTTVVPAGATRLRVESPSTAAPAVSLPAPAGEKAAAPVKQPEPAPSDPGADDDAGPREEPTDPDGRSGTADIRKFSEGRPVAGVDPQFG